MADFLRSGPAEGPLLLLAHGAGAPMDSPFMTAMTAALAERGMAVARFEFAYMAARRTGERRPPPPRADRLIEEYATAIAAAAGRPLFIGGKSLGGRVASMIAGREFDQGRIKGLICLGYPFHPPGKPDSLRTAHLADLTCPALIVQGERDPFGTRAEVGSYDLSPRISLAWIPEANHDLKAPKRSGLSAEDCLTMAADAVAAFIADKA